MTAPVQDNLPAAVRRQVNEANALIAELNAKPGEIPAGTVVQQLPNDQQPGTNVTGQQVRWAPPPAPDPTQAGQIQQVNQPAPLAPPSSEAAAAPLHEENPAWEQRYRSLQGKYDAETRMTREIMAQQQATMDKLIERQNAAAAPIPAPAPEQTNEEFLRSLGVSTKEIEDYGELLPIMARMARNMIQPTATKLEGELNRVRQAAGTTSAALVEDRRRAMFQAMDANPAIANWRVINDDENFLAWLDRYDIFLGSTRRVALMDAFQKLDTARLTAIFERFIQEDAAQRSTSRPMVNAETLIAPGAPRGQPPVAPGGAQGKKILLESEVKDFYSRVRRKQVSPEAYKAFSAEIAAASAEGRIRPDRVEHHGNSR